MSDYTTTDYTTQPPNRQLDLFFQKRYRELLAYGIARAYLAGPGLVLVSEMSNEPVIDFIPLPNVQDAEGSLRDLIKVADPRRNAIVGVQPPEGGPLYVRRLEWEV